MSNLKISVYWYVPNIISYIRLILLALVLLLFKNMPLTAIICYIFSSLLDAVDGFLARVLNQSSNIGVILDYCTDRLSLAVLVASLILVIPKFWVLWVIILGLDLFSHFCQLYFTVLNNDVHHKNTSNIIKFKSLRLYYSSRLVLFTSCLSKELLLGMYLIYSLWPAKWMIAVIIVLVPGFVFKVWINILQIVQSIQYAAGLEKR
ncbi:MAG: hypothetical protein K0R14_82 [Burkholderiales bacterium]|jgi:CDP-diacylglycerol--inositol 3-phosphatidyltransferase|nr:hypothetical protein [Burkholderiales bacterium]